MVEIDALNIEKGLDRDNKISILNVVMGIIHSEQLIGFEVDIEKYLNQKDYIKGVYPNFKHLDNKELLEKLIYSYVGKSDEIDKNFIENLGIFIFY